MARRCKGAGVTFVLIVYLMCPAALLVMAGFPYVTTAACALHPIFNDAIMDALSDVFCSRWLLKLFTYDTVSYRYPCLPLASVIISVKYKDMAIPAPSSANRTAREPVSLRLEIKST